MTDLNTAIAKYKGWHCKNIGTFDNPRNVWYLGNIASGIDELPDYEHDARLYMALFEEMPNGTIIQKLENGYSVVYLPVDRDLKAESDTIGSTICLAYCKLKGIEVVG